MSKNIIHITGNNSHAIEKEVARWVGAFEMKYGQENIERIALDDRARFSVTRDNIMASGLFSEKRLFIFSGGIEKKTKGGVGFEEILEKIKNDIPEDHFLLFHHIGAKETGLIGSYDIWGKTFAPGWLQKNAEVREMNTVWEIGYWQKHFGDLDTKVIQEVLSRYRSGDATQTLGDKNINIGHLIGNTLQMISLGSQGGGEAHVEDLIYTEWGYSTFNLTDAIIDERYDTAINIFRKIVEHTKIHEFLPGFIGALRNSLYAKYLLSSGMSGGKIGQIIAMNQYTLQKNLTSRISGAKIGQLYQKLVSIDRAYKSGKGLQDDELGRIFSIELALLELKK